ncbi:SWIM zinc finger family protein [Prosthecodimorpha staleyi]|uniref:SWIM zinc finger domain-containing protein n=1 Tax=Prosthecodimorpha staleyi TaxID=2840188 RepID=A0A947D945_9HYPH|nr:SWIM zinc finger family protein [Prosthecodimorpha staleyi]MBT9292990.1 SWIM zinc finger domain-containing protein [Prosthecodimorpha staleyi]
MTGTRLAAAYRDVTEADLASASSHGLVRRAKADAASGRGVAALSETGEFTFAIDGETARLGVGGLAKSRCSCPSPILCRHRIAAVFALQGQGAGLSDKVPPAAVPTVPADAVPADAAPEVPPRTPKAAGPGRGERPAVPSDDGAASDRPAAVGDRGSAGSAARQPSRRAAAAAVPDWPRRVEALLGRIFATGLSVASDRFDRELADFAAAARAAGRPDVAAGLGTIADGLDRARRRDPASDVRTLLVDLGLAAAAAGRDDAFADGVGNAERRPAEAAAPPLPPDMELIGLGGHLWVAPSGARGVTAAFYDTAAGIIRHATLVRAHGQDPGFEPARGYFDAAVWGHVLADLSGRRFRLQDAVATSRGDIATARHGRVTAAEPWAAAIEAVSAWPVAFDDWSRLQAHLRERLDATAASWEEAIATAILMPSASAPLERDAVRHAVRWPIVDGGGRWLGLEIDAEPAARARIEALGRLTEHGAPWAVVVAAGIRDGRIALTPFALIERTTLALDCARPAAASAASEPTVRIAPPQFAEDRSGTATERLIDDALDRILTLAEQGEAAGPAVHRATAGDLATAVRAAALEPVAGLLDRVVAASDAGLPARWLRVVFALAATRHARLKLPLLRRVRA